MNIKKQIRLLKKSYPNAKIILNNKTKPSEIIGELETDNQNTKHSIAIAIIDKSITTYIKK